MQQRRLTRSQHDKKIAGVCGGLAEYLNVDPTLVRVGFVCLSLFSAAFPGIIIYIALALIVPSA